ncbi:MAG: hypothetical protein A2901_01600 [Elusimicrobia bacterium RIFCSPLOWO2_01_FULL_54_10]|nr:MAG: hypothetical protein A2901_01600 [Elusimicrobia bacterium RIFCSPLOWO2_01_FULL_54_10]
MKADWILGSNEPVVDRHKSHIHEDAARFLAPTLYRVESKGRPFIVETVEFDSTVGKSVCVETTDADEIVYAQRQGRRGLSRFVKNREAEPTDAVTVVLKKDSREDYYVLIAAWCGATAEKEPWDPNIRDPDELFRAQDFWASHALIWGSEPIVPGTETAVCPW